MIKAIVIESGLLGQRQQEKPTTSPWGQVDQCEEILPGMWAVSTPSHGGIKLSPERAAKVPRYFKTWLGGFTWYEEDCDWAIPYLIFEDELKEHGDAHAKRTIEKNYHRDSLSHECGGHREAYARYQEENKQLF